MNVLEIELAVMATPACHGAADRQQQIGNIFDIFLFIHIA